MLEITFDQSLNIPGFNIQDESCDSDYVFQIIRSHLVLHFNENPKIDFYAICNGKKLNHEKLSIGVVHVVPCMPGGKGGFGSMLRAIGAQIEKTTNREACRDLSGRRLRDINEEKRLKKWIADQAERERNAAERKKKKLSKLCIEPKHEFSDPNYDKARSDLTDRVHDAVEEGYKCVKSVTEPSASMTDNNSKRKAPNEKRIKGTLWVDELEDLEDLESEESEDETPKKKMKIDE